MKRSLESPLEGPGHKRQRTHHQSEETQPAIANQGSSSETSSLAQHPPSTSLPTRSRVPPTAQANARFSTATAHASSSSAIQPSPTTVEPPPRSHEPTEMIQRSRHAQAMAPSLPVAAGTASSMQSCHISTTGGNLAITTAGTINQYCGQPGQQRNVDQQVLDWLSTLRYHAIQQDTFEKVVKGTGGWLLNRKDFNDWLSSASGTLWGVGIPGAGKTFLASIVIDHLKQHIRPPFEQPEDDHHSIVVYAFCRYEDDLSATQILASLLRQLAEGSEEAARNIKTKLYEPCMSQSTSLTLSSVKSTIEACLKSLRRVYIVMDALDELQDDVRQELVTFLDSLKVALFLTSREIHLDMRASHWHDFLIRPPAEDFRAFVASEVKRYPNLVSLFQGNDVVLNEIIEQMETQSNGMFLLAALQISAVRRTTNLSNLKRQIKALPTTLDEMYNLTVERIISQEDDMKMLALRAILWVTYAVRSLRLDELLVALSIESDTTKLDPAACTNESILVSACLGLVTVERENGIIRLVHFTAQDFFTAYRTGIFQTPHAFIADTCAAYLQISAYNWEALPTQKGRPLCIGFDKFASSRPLCDYACRNMGVHLARNLVHPRKSNDIPKATLDFLLARENKPSLILLLGSPETSPSSWYHLIKRDIGTATHFAAFYGLLPLFDLLAGDVNAFSIGGYTPLFYACKNGHTAAVAHLLLQPSIGVNDPVDCGGEWTALGAACSADHLMRDVLYNSGSLEGVVKVLLTTPGIDVNKGFPLSWASNHGFDSIVKLLLAAPGIDVDAEDSMGCNAFIGALEAGWISIARLILDSPHSQASIKPLGQPGHCLFLAVYCGSVTILRRILSFPSITSTVNTLDYDGWTPFHHACYQGNKEVVQLFLEVTGIDINEGGPGQPSVYEEIVALLRERGSSEWRYDSDGKVWSDDGSDSNDESDSDDELDSDEGWNSDEALDSSDELESEDDLNSDSDGSSDGSTTSA